MPILILGVDAKMPAHRVNRDHAETAMSDLSSLSSALARVQRVAGTSTITIARKIGFAVGLELSSGKSRSSDVHSELVALFRRLSLGKVTVREWDPVVFVTHNDSKKEGLEAAFSEGVLEGIMHARSRVHVFVKHSTTEGKLHNTIRFRSNQKSRRGNKT